MKKIRKLKLKDKPVVKPNSYHATIAVNFEKRSLEMFSTVNQNASPVLEYSILLDEYLMFETLFLKNQEALRFIQQSENFKHADLKIIERFITTTIIASSIDVHYYLPEEVLFKVTDTRDGIIFLVAKEDALSSSPFIPESQSTKRTEVIGGIRVRTLNINEPLFTFSENLLDVIRLKKLIRTLSNVQRNHGHVADFFEHLFKSQLIANVSQCSYNDTRYSTYLDEINRTFTLCKLNNDGNGNEQKVLELAMDSFLNGDVILEHPVIINIFNSLRFIDTYSNNPHELLFKLFSNNNMIHDKRLGEVARLAKTSIGNKIAPEVFDFNKKYLTYPTAEQVTSIINPIKTNSSSTFNSLLAYKIVNGNINIYKVDTSAKLYDTYIEIENYVNCNMHTKIAKTLFSNSPKVELLVTLNASTSNKDITDVLMLEVDKISNENLSNLEELQKFVNVLIVMQRFHSAITLLQKIGKTDYLNTEPKCNIKQINEQFNVLLIT